MFFYSSGMYITAACIVFILVCTLCFYVKLILCFVAARVVATIRTSCKILCDAVTVLHYFLCCSYSRMYLTRLCDTINCCLNCGNSHMYICVAVILPHFCDDARIAPHCCLCCYSRMYSTRLHDTNTVALCCLCCCIMLLYDGSSVLHRHFLFLDEGRKGIHAMLMTYVCLCMYM